MNTLFNLHTVQCITEFEYRSTPNKACKQKIVVLSKFPHNDLFTSTGYFKLYTST